MPDRYCLISPCRDEADYAQSTLDTVLRQSVRPERWIIVNDGSTDESPAILARYARRHPWITVIHRSSNERRLGGGVVDAFYEGLGHVNIEEFDFICKLDMDLKLPERYFEILIDRMHKNPRLGTCSGKPYYPLKSNRDNSFDGPLLSEACSDDMSVGMTKFYRVECFQEIGGFVREVMWDGIDCHRCRMLGWEAASWDEPELRFLHLRPMGSSHRGILTGRVRHGFGQHFMGTAPSYMLASAAYRMTRPPFVVGGLAMLWGYAKSVWQRRPQYDDTEFRRFVRHYQWLCLTRGRRYAMREVRRSRIDEASRPVAVRSS
jgi:glycosyltransferase involved in cell wall biosynthesis